MPYLLRCLLLLLSHLGYSLITFTLCCLVWVLCVFPGFEDLLQEIEVVRELINRVERVYGRRVVVPECVRVLFGDVSRVKFGEVSRLDFARRFRRFRDVLYLVYFVLCVLDRCRDLIRRVKSPLDARGRRVISLVRRGLQFGAQVLPNLYLESRLGRVVSVFISVPPKPTTLSIPESARSMLNLLSQVLNLDVLVYGRYVTSMLDVDSEVPVRGGGFAVVCRSSSGWWERSRAVPDVELFKRLVDARLSSSCREVVSSCLVLSGDVPYIKEVGLLCMVPEVYSCRLIVVSRCRVPGDVRDLLSRFGIEVVDSVVPRSEGEERVISMFRDVLLYGVVER